jgi:hypothetical protein
LYIVLGALPQSFAMATGYSLLTLTFVAKDELEVVESHVVAQGLVTHHGQFGEGWIQQRWSRPNAQWHWSSYQRNA